MGERLLNMPKNQYQEWMPKNQYQEWRLKFDCRSIGLNVVRGMLKNKDESCEFAWNSALWATRIEKAVYEAILRDRKNRDIQTEQDYSI